MNRTIVVIIYFFVILHLPVGHAHHWTRRNRKPHVLPRHVLPRDIGGLLKDNVNAYVDKVVTSLSTKLSQMGYDPMALPNEKRHISVKDFMGLQWYGKLELYNGTLENLSTMKRDGDAAISYNNTQLDVNVTLTFDDLKLTYKYHASIMNIGPHGSVRAIVSGLQVKLELRANVKTMKMKLKNLHLLDVSKIKVHTTGLLNADILVESIADRVIHIFKKVILKIAERRVKEEAENAIESIDLQEYIG